ncbi:MAG: ATP-binding protein [Acidobacteriia bacterium]|nr:ATP-binding protein [Terriglobia bacterium]
MLVLNQQVPDSDRKTLAEIVGLICEKRKNHWQDIIVSSALIREGEVWRNLFTKVEPTRRGTKAPKLARLNYHNVLFFRELIPPEAVGLYLQRLVLEGLLNCPLKYGDVQLEGSFGGSSITPDRAWQMRTEFSDWPAAVYCFEPAQQFRIFPNPQPLIGIDEPYYQDWGHFLRDQFGIDTGNWLGYFNGQVRVVVPDYRARIASLTIASGFIEVELDCGVARPDNLLAKVYAEDHDGALTQETLPISKPKFRIKTKDQSTFASVAILTKDTGEPLDQKVFKHGLSWEQPGVHLRAKQLEVEQLLAVGECDTIEFKREIDRAHKLAQTIAAFANTKGGTVVIGVDNENNVVGCEPRGLNDKITNIVRSHCDPPVTVSIRKIVYKEKVLVLVHVLESRGRVHTVRDWGVYIRANATNRIPSADELESLFIRRRGAAGQS